jgi:hypothetical protein
MLRGDKSDQLKMPLQHSLGRQLPPAFEHRCVHTTKVGRVPEIAAIIERAQ